ncbi:MAG: hypothetical protein H0W84_13730 [Bacteroidetes bacterium]|nr:hypothetical protein [Bacteroidota bacterium]
MKDKSRFVSSVIVSLLAGFIYYQFGQGIEENLQSSIKAVLNSNDMEQYLSPDCQPFNTISNKSDSKQSKKKSKYFIKKRNTIEFKTKNETIPGDELFSSYVSQKQAKFQKSTPDKNMDFTSELRLLMEKDNSKSQLRQSKGLKIDNNKLNEDNSVADTKELSSSRPERIQKNFDKTNVGAYGNGFEYNYIIVTKKNKSTIKIKIEQKKTDCNSNFNCNENFVPFQSYESYKNNESYRERVVNKMKTPKAPGKIHDKDEDIDNDKDMDNDQPEIIIPFQNGNEDEM